MNEAMSPNLSPSSSLDLTSLHDSIEASVKNEGAWTTYGRLLELRTMNPEDMRIRGYCEVVRGVIVRDFISRPKGLHASPRLTSEFLANFDRFNLSAQEGYLVSLIDGRLDLQKILVLCPFDAFTALFNLAALENQKAITVPS